MSGPFSRRLQRARELAPGFPEAAPLLTLYLPVVELQQEIYDAALAGSAGPAPLLEFFPRLQALVKRYGPSPLARAAEPTEESLLAFWQGERKSTDGTQFYARALLQPWAERLRAASPANEQEWTAGEGCPFCAAAPGAAVLRPEGDGGKRSLSCSLCAGEWLFRRILCPYCGETDREKLPSYRSEAIPQVRVEACDTCRCYLKTVDLTVDGHAIPVVDELVTLSLNIWAEESGYCKHEPNLLGM